MVVIGVIAVAIGFSCRFVFRTNPSVGNAYVNIVGCGGGEMQDSQIMEEFLKEIDEFQGKWERKLIEHMMSIGGMNEDRYCIQSPSIAHMVSDGSF